MLSIQECLDNIKSAVFGRDVRQSIHDGIKGIDDESKADMKKKQEKIDTYTDKMDLLNDKYEEQIKNLTLNSPSDAEIVDSRRTKDNTVFSTLKERLDEDKNSIWIQKQLTSVATLDETPDQLGLLKINIPANCVLDKDTLSITPVYKNGDGDALTGSAFTKIEKGEKLEFTIEKVYFDSLCYDVLEDQGVQGGSMGSLEFPVDLNVKVSYLTATETKVNQFVGKPEELNTAAKNDLVSAVNELKREIDNGLNNVYKKSETYSKSEVYSKNEIDSKETVIKTSFVCSEVPVIFSYPSGYNQTNCYLVAGSKWYTNDWSSPVDPSKIMFSSDGISYAHEQGMALSATYQIRMLLRKF